MFQELQLQMELELLYYILVLITGILFRPISIQRDSPIGFCITYMPFIKESQNLFVLFWTAQIVRENIRWALSDESDEEVHIVNKGSKVRSWQVHALDVDDTIPHDCLVGQVLRQGLRLEWILPSFGWRSEDYNRQQRSLIPVCRFSSKTLLAWW